jgi:hypothetical protein
VPNAISQLIDFRDREWIKHGHSFQSALLEAVRYLHFLEIIKARLEDAGKEYTELVNARMREVGGHRKLTNEEQKQLEHEMHLSSVIQLEIESFYLFSKIYLDIIAHFLSIYFSQLPNFRFESFQKLFGPKAAIWESPPVLKIEPRFREVIRRLMDEIVYFRSKRIVHPQLSRGRNLVGNRSHALTWRSDGSSGISLTVGLSRSESPSDFYRSANVQDLCGLIEQFTSLLIQFLIQNKDRAKIAVKAQSHAE